ncbi:Hypp2722 [Branchiostoma lanceolatum]|uniref:Hypp2722 protein n=1 Tax=Branchiostoma lanceolatum TaxID=7740 RepID=A0A8J9ZWK1_BRALA|nr:Hypp2722 [Branchiostoma lanceolatum]
MRRQLRPSWWETSLHSGVRGFRCSAGNTAQKTSFPAQPAVKTSFNEKDRSICATYSPQPWDFDHTGGVPIWKLLHHTSLLWMDMHRHWFTPPEGGPPFTDLFFGRCIFLDFSRSYHNQVFPGCSLPHTLRISKIGKTSFFLEQRILETTGKTVQPFGPLAAEPSFVYTVTAAPSDTDFLRHVSHYQYVRYCCDCVSFGAEKGAYSIITGDMAQYKIKRFELLNLGEARTGDVLTVTSWEDPAQSDLIKFQIKKGEGIITQCSMQFFTDNSKM